MKGKVTVSVRLTVEDVAALRAEAERRVRLGIADRVDKSRLIREQVRAAPWYASAEE